MTNYFVLAGIAIVVIGFALRLNPMLVVTVAALATGLIAGKGPIEIVSLLPTFSFRSTPIVIVSLLSTVSVRSCLTCVISVVDRLRPPRKPPADVRTCSRAVHMARAGDVSHLPRARSSTGPRR